MLCVGNELFGWYANAGFSVYKWVMDLQWTGVNLKPCHSVCTCVFCVLCALAQDDIRCGTVVLILNFKLYVNYDGLRTILLCSKSKLKQQISTITSWLISNKTYDSYDRPRAITKNKKKKKKRKVLPYFVAELNEWVVTRARKGWNRNRAFLSHRWNRTNRPLNQIHSVICS